MLAATLLLVLLLVGSGWAVPDYSDCAENVATLEEALYANGKNVLELNRLFFPSAPRFALVNYSFLNENNEIDDCNVTYAWSTSPFLIVLPPTLFRWSSLHFFYPNDELDDLTIVLPYDCRPLVNSSLIKNCTCDVEDPSLLDHLTQQVK